MSKTVLIIDDDVAFADFLRAAIESVGHGVRVVTTGTDALAAFADCRPDLVFLDLLLPGRDGFKVCEDLRAHPHGNSVPIVMMTGIYKKAVYEREGLEKYRASAYLFKPFGIRETWSLVERFLGASDRAPEPIPLPGDSLADTTLATILARHLERKDDGILFVRGHDATQVLYLRAGAPIFARSNHPDDRLDRVLLRLGQVKEEQVRAALATVADGRGKTRLGQALVDMGALRPEQLETALQLQLQLMLSRAFGLAAGRCFFVSGEHPTEEDVLLATPPAVVLFRGARGAGSDAAVRRSLPPSGAKLSRAPGWEKTAAALNLKAVEQQLLQLVDDGCSLDRFLAVANVGGTDGPRLLLAFACAGLLSAQPTVAPAEETAAQPAEFDVTTWSERPFAATLLELVGKGHTGRLTVSTQRGGPAKHVVFRAGRVVDCESDLLEDRLYDMLVALQLVPESTLSEVLNTVGDDADDQAVQAEVLRRELLAPTELYWARVYQAMNAVNGLLALPSAALAWTPEARDVCALPDIETAELAWDAARCLSAGEAVAMLPDEDARVTAMPGAKELSASMPLTAEESTVLTALSTPRTIASLLTLGPHDDVRRTLCALIATGLARTNAPARAGHVAATAEPDFIDMLHEEALPLDYRTKEVSSPRIEPKPNVVAMRREPSPAPRIASVAPSSESTMADCERRLGVVVSQLRALRPLVRTLRTGMEGDGRRVEVDRFSMRELLENMLRLIGETCDVQAALSSALRDPAGGSEGEEKAAHRQPMEAGVAS